MTPDGIFEDLEIELALEIRAWLTMAEQASIEGDRWAVEIHKGRADALHTFGLWMAAHFQRSVDDGGR